MFELNIHPSYEIDPSVEEITHLRSPSSLVSHSHRTRKSISAQLSFRASEQKSKADIRVTTCVDLFYFKNASYFMDF